MAVELNFSCSDIRPWQETLGSYPTRIASLNKPELVSLDEFYRSQLPPLLRSRFPAPYLTRSELASLMQWKLTRGKFRPRLLGFVMSLDEELVKSASEKAFLSLSLIYPWLFPSLPFSREWAPPPPPPSSPPIPPMSPPSCPTRFKIRAMEAALGNSKDYTLKQCIAFARVEHRRRTIHSIRCGKGTLELSCWC